MYFKNLFSRNLSYPVLTLFILLFVIFYPSLSISKIFKIQDIQIEEPFNLDFDKEKVINKAFVIAFDKLVSSLITSKDKNKIKNTSLRDIKYLIDSFTINNEQFQNKNYLANLDVNFNKSNIFNFFEKKNIFPSMFKKKNFLTILILIDNDESKVLLFEKNPFYRNWNQSVDQSSQINFVLHEDDLFDLKMINENKDNIENFKFDEIIKKYDLKDYIVSIYFKNKNKINVLSKIFFNNQMKIFNLSFSEISNLEDQKVNMIIKENKILFEDVWKKANQINTSIKLPINLIINSKETNKISELEKYLNEIDLVSNFFITNFNNQETTYKVIFNGRPDQFLALMEENQIYLDIDEKIWKVK